MFVPERKLYPWELRWIVSQFKVIGQGFVGTLVKLLNRLSGMHDLSRELKWGQADQTMYRPSGNTLLKGIVEVKKEFGIAFPEEIGGIDGERRVGADVVGKGAVERLEACVFFR